MPPGSPRAAQPGGRNCFLCGDIILPMPGWLLRCARPLRASWPRGGSLHRGRVRRIGRVGSAWLGRILRSAAALERSRSSWRRARQMYGRAGFANAAPPHPAQLTPRTVTTESETEPLRGQSRWMVSDPLIMSAGIRGGRPHDEFHGCLLYASSRWRAPRFGYAGSQCEVQWEFIVAFM